MSSYQPFTGAPIFYQGYGVPSNNYSINVASYTQGGLQYYLDRNTNIVYWLQYFNNNECTWTQFPANIPDLNYIGILPQLQRLYWFTSNDDPTTEIPAPPLFNGEYGMFWWNRTTGEFFKLISYDSDGTNLVWESIIPPLGT